MLAASDAVLREANFFKVGLIGMVFLDTANGLTGEVGGLKGGTLRDSVVNPGFMTNPTIDRLERAQRLTAGIPAEFGGESGSNIRTGRRGEAVLSAVVDFPVQEKIWKLYGRDWWKF